MNKKLFIILLFSTFLSWCSLLSYLGETMCTYAPDSDHCFQWSAINWWNESYCERIKWTKFKAGWSNPPKDKCYMQIAINKWDYSLCSKIKWWNMSYSKDECIFEAAITNDDASWCKLLNKSSAHYSQCVWKLISNEKMIQADKLLSDIEGQLDVDPRDKKLLAEYEKLRKWSRIQK